MSENSDLAAIEHGGARGPSDPLGVFANLVAAIGTIWTFLLMFLIVADVVGRSFLSMPITGVAEIAAHSIVAIVFLQLAAAVHARRMTRADFLIERLHVDAPALAAGIEAVFLFIGAMIMLIIAYAGWTPLAAAWTGNEFFGVRGVFTIATWPIRAIILFGSVLAAGVFLAQMREELSRMAKLAATAGR
jgi:TRAP-type mannitol/chloroaromatic compound transport system permease small subunit